MTKQNQIETLTARLDELESRLARFESTPFVMAHVEASERDRAAAKLGAEREAARRAEKAADDAKFRAECEQIPWVRILLKPDKDPFVNWIEIPGGSLGKIKARPGHVVHHERAITWTQRLVGDPQLVEMIEIGELIVEPITDVTHRMRLEREARR